MVCETSPTFQEGQIYLPVREGGGLGIVLSWQYLSSLPRGVGNGSFKPRDGSGGEK